MYIDALYVYSIYFDWRLRPYCEIIKLYVSYI